jgi:hypothetical protein
LELRIKRNKTKQNKTIENKTIENGTMRYYRRMETRGGREDKEDTYIKMNF